MTIADKAVLVTGANRGIGRALVEEALQRGAKRVYAGTRQPLAHPDGPIRPRTLDVTSPAQTQAAAESVDALDVLVNNAGTWLYDDLSDRAMLKGHLAVNFFGTWSTEDRRVTALSAAAWGRHRRPGSLHGDVPPCTSTGWPEPDQAERILRPAQQPAATADAGLSFQFAFSSMVFPASAVTRNTSPGRSCRGRAARYLPRPDMSPGACLRGVRRIVLITSSPEGGRSGF
jgi:NAD(P)-dependent dehydrogenase (short-subunit alcohol dehydrogenase family)